jgi:hypothetical protein
MLDCSVSYDTITSCLTSAAAKPSSSGISRVTKGLYELDDRLRG